jgi:hypothetical protein
VAYYASLSVYGRLAWYPTSNSGRGRERTLTLNTIEGERVMTWTIWVGGSEINSYYLSQSEAVSIAREWIAEGYSDVIVGEVSQ